MEKEVFLPVKGYEGLYEVSNFGRVKSLQRVVLDKDGNYRTFNEKFLTLHKTKPRGNQKIRYVVELWKENKRKVIGIHRVVAINFLPNPENKPQVNHIDGNPKNNNLNNLEWVTNSENMKHAYSTGLAIPRQKKPVKGTHTKTGEFVFYESAESAGRDLGCNPGTIRNCLKGRAKTGKGYVWEYQ